MMTFSLIIWKVLQEAVHTGCDEMRTRMFDMLYTKTPKDVRMIMIDPKHVELGPYKGIPHLLLPVVTGTKQSLSAMEYVRAEMNNRYQQFSELGVRNLKGFNEKVGEEKKLSSIVVLIDEYMEMMFEAPKDLEAIVASVARLGRAAGSHLVMATQRPSSDVITGAIKSNIPCRASFTVVDWRESKTIIDRTGAERLLGSGDMLYSSAVNSFPVHAQAAYVSEGEIDSVIAYVKAGNKTQ